MPNGVLGAQQGPDEGKTDGWMSSDRCFGGAGRLYLMTLEPTHESWVGALDQLRENLF